MKYIKLFENWQILNESSKKDIVNFLLDKKFVNPKSKMFLYHGTDMNPEKFNLRDDYDFEDSNYDYLPYGYLFLTTSLEEASAYGKYIIPCELKKYDSLIFKINADNPSQVFDKDYGIDLYKNKEYFGFMDKFEYSGKSILIIKGINKQTIISPDNNVVPRTDLAKEFYKLI